MEVSTDIGVGLFAYYLTCDTDSIALNVTNPMNTNIDTTTVSLVVAMGQIKELTNIFTEQANTVGRTYDAACPGPADPNPCEDSTHSNHLIYTAKNDFAEDKKNVDAAVEVASAELNQLVAFLIGENQTLADLVIPNQGLVAGFFSVVNCYQFNSRYQAVANLMCTQVFTTIGMTLEYCLVALILMVVVEFLKRWARPYNDEYKTDNKVAPDDRWATKA
jgi:hypothetical protein